MVNLMVAIASLGGLLFGYETGVAAGALHSAQAVWGLQDFHLIGMSSATLVGAFCGALVAGRLADTVGRRDVIMATAALFTLGAFLSAISPGIEVLLLARLVAGLGAGAVSVAAPLYIGEIAPKERRGSLVCIFQLMVTLGILGAYLGHDHLDMAPDGWRYLLGLGALPALLLSGLALLLPESPFWLALQGDCEGAEESERRLGRARASVSEKPASSVPEGHGLFSLAGRRGLFLCIGLFFFQQFVGINALLYFAPSVLEGLALAPAAPTFLSAAMVLALVNVAGSLLALASVDRLGRRPLLLAGLAGMTVALVLVSIGLGPAASSGLPGQWIAALGLLLFTFCFAFGIGPLAWVAVAELPSPSARGLAVGLVVASHWLFDSLASPMGLLLSRDSGQGVIFGFYALVAACGFLLFRRIMPENRGLSLADIHRRSLQWASTVKQSRFVHYAATSLVATGGMLTGYNFAVAAGTLVLIAEQWDLSPLAQGMLVSSIILGMVFGSFLAGGWADRFGRRYLLMSVAALAVAGAFGCALAPSLPWLLLARAAVGFAVGIIAPTVALYVAEIAPSAIRGRLLTFDAVTYGIGTIVAYYVCLIFEPVPEGWRYMFAFVAFPSTVYGLALLALPESPRWLASKGKISAARRMLRRLEEAEDEGVLRELAAGAVAAEGTGWRSLRAPAARPALTLGLVLVFLLVFSGWDMVLFYAPTLLQQIGFADTAASLAATLGLGFVFLAMTILSLSLIDRIGRKPLMVSGLTIMGLCLCIMGLLTALPGDLGGMQRWLMLALLAVFVAVFALTLGQVAEVVVAEIYPQAIRGPATSFTHGIRSIFAIAFTLLLPLQLHSLGLAATFLCYGAICLAGVVYLAKALPETRSLSLEQIDRYWAGRAAEAAR